jgi:methyl-accepting chemotaxis protein
MRLLRRIGLRYVLYLIFPSALLLVLVGLGVSVTGQVEDGLREGMRRRGEAGVRSLAGRTALPLLRGKKDLAEQAIVDTFEDKDVAYVFVLKPDRTLLASKVADAFKDRFEKLLAEHDRHGDAPFFATDDVLAFAQTVRDVESEGGDEPVVSAGRAVIRGYVLLGLSTSPMKSQLSRMMGVIGWFLLGGAALFGLLVYLITSQFVLKPIEGMREMAERMSEGDLTARGEKFAEDEMGLMAESLNRLGDSLNAMMARVKGVAESVGLVITRIANTGEVVANGAGTVSGRVEETSTSMSEMLRSLKGIGENVEVLAQSAEESSSSILEMAATNDEVAENIQSLAASVEETTAAIEQMTFSIKEVAKNIEDLSATTEETSSSMNEMDVSISQVETNANETAKLSEQAQKDAEGGADSISRTLAGIDKIKESSREAARVIEALGKKIGTIGNILNVIDDVAEQTNLLALNAAILAAQSGEHGKGFAVVADEIKDLAERTGASTKEISELIRSVQEESRNAVEAMDRGVKNVEEGVRLGQEAEGALKKIQDSSQKSTQMVKAIARATIEQARGSKQVTMAINRIAETVQQIASATAEQARGSEQIMKSAEKMKIITKHVERSSQEQARGSKQITRSIESISEMVNSLNRAQKDQTRGSEQVMAAVEAIKQVAEAQTRTVKELEAAIDDLSGQAGILGGEVRRFKL